MSFKPMKPAQFDVSNVKFSPVKDGAIMKCVFLSYDDKFICLQAPEMEVTFDAGYFKHNSDGSPDSGKYEIEVSMKKDGEFCQKMQELDEVVKKAAMENSVAWFKKKTMTMDTVENVYNPIVKPSTDRETGEPDGKYPPRFKFKIHKKSGNVQCACFDANAEIDPVTKKKKQMNVTDADKDDYVCLGTDTPYDDRKTTPHKGVFKKGALVKVLLRFRNIWIVNGKFGCSWSAEQMRIKPKVDFDNYAFLDDTDEEEGGEKIEGNFVDSSDDDDDDDEDGLSRQVSKKQ
jgi:hypothetical protein